jgi:hypothetical protein
MSYCCRQSTKAASTRWKRIICCTTRWFKAHNTAQSNITGAHYTKDRYSPASCSIMTNSKLLEASWNVMAHAQKPDFFFRRKGRVRLNWRGRRFSRLLAAELCASAVVMLDTPCSEAECKTAGYPLFRHFPLHYPSRASPCAITFQLESTSLPTKEVDMTVPVWIKIWPIVQSKAYYNSKLINSGHLVLYAIGL